MDIIQLIQDFGINIVASLAFVVIGSVLTRVYDFINRNFRHRHIYKILGNRAEVRGNIALILPIYSPITDKHFTQDESSISVLYKRGNPRLGMIDETERIIKANRGELREVPIFSDMIVYDDYYAFKEFEKLLIDSDYGVIEFIGDVDALDIWDRKLMLLVGGPRSNQKLSQVLGETDVRKFIEIVEKAHYLAAWQLICRISNKKKKRTYKLCAEENHQYSVILKVSNPQRKEPGYKIILVAGDRATATKMGANFFCKNIVRLSKVYGDKDFMLVLRGIDGAKDGGKSVLEGAIEGGRVVVTGAIEGWEESPEEGSKVPAKEAGKAGSDVEH